MEHHREKDEEGNEFTYVSFRGHMFMDGFPKDPETRLDEIKTFKCRDDDIFLCSYPKSGLPWVGNIVSMMTSGDMSYKGMPKLIEDADFDCLNNMASPRVLGFHALYSMLPKDVQQGKGRIIRIIRNPKDVLVSAFEFVRQLTADWYKGNFNGYFRLCFQDKLYLGNWFNYEKDLHLSKEKYKDLRILLLTYEDLKKDTMQCIRAINEFLQLDRSEDFMNEVEENVKFERLKAAYETTAHPEVHKKSDGVLPVYRKGVVGDWKNYFTVAQNEFFDREYAVRMEGCDMPVTFE